MLVIVSIRFSDTYVVMRIDLGIARLLSLPELCAEYLRVTAIAGL